MNANPPNKGVFTYSVRLRKRYERRTCGVWQGWVTLGKYPLEAQARTHIDAMTLQSGVEQVAVFYRSHKLK